MDFGLDDDQELVISAVRRYVDREIRPAAAEADRAAKVPQGVLKKAAELGFLLDGVPEKEGGLCEESYSHLARALRGYELGKGCSAFAALLETNVEPALALARWGNADTRRMLFGSLVAGNLAVYYKDAGARLTISNGKVSGETGPLPALAMASWMVCSSGGSLYLVPIAGDSVTALAPSGWRAAAWGRARFDGAAAHLVTSDAAALAEIDSWFHVSLAARALGSARAAIAFSKSYGAERVQFGKPIGKFEALKQICDDNETFIEAAWLLVRKAAWEIDNKLPDAADTASRARVLAAQVVGRATIDSVQVHGGYGFVNDFPVEKLMRDAPAYAVLGGEEGFARIAEGLDGHP